MYSIDDLFDIPQNSKKISKQEAEPNGVIPIYSSDTSNNGIVGYCNKKPHWLVTSKRPLYLIFGDHTRSFNIADQSFCIADNVKVLIPKYMQMNDRVLLYISTVWRKCIPNLGYARHWSKAKLSMLRLPKTIRGEIDFAYMSERVRELEEERVRELEAYLQEAGFEDCTLTKEEKVALNDIECGKKQMRKCDIVKTFHVDNSHNILKSEVVFGSGTTPYVTASEGNNSIVSYISYKPNMMEHGNSIMIGGKTLVITYQPRDFFSNDSHNLVLTVNDKSGRNESAQLYIVAALYKTLSPKYSWGDSISKAKIQKDVVYLPVKNDGKTVDYSFMETYISAIKKQCIARLKQEIDIERKAYNKVLATQHQEPIDIKHIEPECSYNDESGVLLVAEPYECYKWNPFDQDFINFFGDDKTILLGCHKNMRHLEWIQGQGIYNIRLGRRKGTMSGKSALFEKTSHLVLYDLHHPTKVQVFNIESCCEMSGQQLKELGYPTQRPGKSYMTFKLSSSSLDITQLNKLRLIERLSEEHPDHVKGAPVFLEP